MKLASNQNIKSMDFDIPNRKLIVYHIGEHHRILQNLESLNFGTRLISSETIDDFIIENKSETERKLLWQVLVINFFFFALELLTGFIYNSMGLVADGLDMLADTIVYSLALFAVSGTIARKNNIAKISGYFQLILAVGGFIEVLRRFLSSSVIPNFKLMILISTLALIGNSICLYLLQKSKSKESHMRASMIFTSNDVIVNVGVIAAGILVYIFENKLPDLIIGTIVFIMVAIGSFRILRLAKN